MIVTMTIVTMVTMSRTNHPHSDTGASVLDNMYTGERTPVAEHASPTVKHRHSWRWKHELNNGIHGNNGCEDKNPGDDDHRCRYREQYISEVVRVFTSVPVYRI